MKKLMGFALLGLLCVAPASSQQTGSLSGAVTSPEGDAMPGVTVEAVGDVLPQPVTTETGAGGEYRFPLLPPGNYTLTFRLEGMGELTRTARVALGANTALDVTMAPEVLAESIDVVAEVSLVDTTSAEIKASVSNELIEALPVGEDYRDLQKLIPGVQYSELAIRGPSGGGSGQDNVYLYDGVNVNLPLFGTLSAEPSTHDVDQVSIVKGGATAQDFNRAAGFTINTISKSGTNEFRGAVGYQLQSHSTTSDDEDPTVEGDEDKDWAEASLGGPVVRDKLFFYASYYRPEVERTGRSNAYGSLPDFDSTRDEFFGRLSFQPTSNLLLHGSYRDSEREEHNSGVGRSSAPSVSTGAEASLEIAIVEGSWVVTGDQFATLRYSDFANETLGVPDTLFGFSPAVNGTLNVGDLASQGLLTVPVPVAGQTAYNAFIAPIINQYGFVENGVRVGGGLVGGAAEINDQDFFRESFQGGYNWLFGSNVTHDVHVGYQWYKDEEDLDRKSNGWGSITVIGGREVSSGKPVFYRARLLQTGITGFPGGQIPNIHSEFESQNLEVNDSIRWGNWSFNAGVLFSNDELYGQGLRKGGSNPSGFELCRDCKYKMYEVEWEDQVQPRLGAVWAYNGRDTVSTSFARYNPAASSLPRAASWARNLATFRNANFDANGNLIDIQTLASSTGKFFQEGLDPRTTDEFVLGTARQLSSEWTGRLTGRYRRSYNFWEDTNNTARQFANAPDYITHELYIPNLSTLTQGIGGSSYVIAELDFAHTKYYEAVAEAEWRGRNASLRASYTWSHYYGNFDQDNTTGSALADNDFNTFIGSSNLADGVGKQLWDMKDGNLHGDRRHQVKVYAFYNLPWRASAGAFAVYQSGQPWEIWTDVSTDNTIRFAEPAGSRRTPAHYQLDLSYTQDFRIGDRFNVQLRGELFNVFDRQTEYAFNPNPFSASFKQPTEYYDPRRLRLALRFEF